MSVEGLEQGPLRRALADAGHGSILEAAMAQDQEGAIDSDSFTNSMQDYLDEGNFRLVLVLDEVSAELERIVAYLDTITVHALTVDLITLNIASTRCARPQRDACFNSNRPQEIFWPERRTDGWRRCFSGFDRGH